MTRRFVILLVLAIPTFSCGGASQNGPRCDTEHLPLPPEGSDNVIENFLGTPVMWPRQAFPLRVVISDDVNPVTQRAMAEAVLAWNDLIGLEVFTVSTMSVIPRDLQGLIWVTEDSLPASDCDRQLLGLARRFYSRGFLGERTSIHHATIRMHDEFNPDVVTSTAIHELGHALGLQHDRSEDSIMYPYNRPNRGGVSEEDRLYIRRMMTRRR